VIPTNNNHKKVLPGQDDITRVQLPNGVVILTRANYESPSVTLSGYLKCGSLFDSEDKLGLAHFTAQALMRGSNGHTFHDIYDALESVGANLGFGASVHNTSFGGRALAEDLPLLLKILSECLREPVFPNDQIDRLKVQILTGLAIRNQDTADMASLAFDETVFADHPYGRPEEGHLHTIPNITRGDLVDFHHSHFGPSGMVIVVVGGITPQVIIEQVQAVLGDWINPEQVEAPMLPSVSPLPQSIRRHIELPGKSQTDLVMGTLGPKRKTDYYMPAMLGNNILGQFGMMGRIGDVVREQAGLAYHASTSLSAWIEAGSWEVSAGVNPANLQRAIELIQSELNRFISEPVSGEELRDSKDNFIGRLPLSMESNSGVANALLNLERFQLGMNYYHEYADMVNNVTPEMILETAQMFIKIDRLAIISSGTAAKE
jgi:zinc protease